MDVIRTPKIKRRYPDFGETFSRARLTVAKYVEMIEKGIFDEGDKIELIHGELINKMPISEEHASCLNRLMKAFFLVILEKNYEISIQNPIRLEDSRPEPDFVLQTQTSWETRNDPTPKDILFLAEVAHSSLNFDRNVKLPLYAENGIQECWIINIENHQIEVYTKPGDGVYDEKKVFKKGELISVSSLEASIKVSDIL